MILPSATFIDSTRLPQSTEEGASTSAKDLNEPPPTTHLARLANDIILDNVFANLDVKDVMTLRQVSSQFRDCTYESAVWKRIINSSQVTDIPPLPPTKRYSFSNLAPLEAERLVTRSISLSAQWDKPSPMYQRRWEMESPRIVVELTLLPGGKHIVASVIDRTRTRYAIEVFTSDFKYSMGFPVARVDLTTQAFELRARYMTIQQRQGILVTYVRREYGRARYVDRYDINDIPVHEDGNPRIAHLYVYECVAMHIPLSSVELLYDRANPIDPSEFRTHASRQRRPFWTLAEITSRARISSPIIDEGVWQGAPIIAVIKRQSKRNPSDRILYKNLDHPPTCTLELTPHPLYPNLPHAIMAFTILPCQNQFLVIRRAGSEPTPHPPESERPRRPDWVDEPEEEHYYPDPQAQTPGPYYFAELYDIVPFPTAKCITATAVSRSGVHDSQGNYWRKVWLSDHGLGPSLAHDHSLRSDLHKSGRQLVAPLPITIFVSAALAMSVSYETLVPTQVASEPAGPDTAGLRWVYTLSDDPLVESIDRVGSHAAVLADMNDLRVLPGSVRPLMVCVPRESMCLRACTFDIGILSAIWDKDLLRWGRKGGGDRGDDDEDENEGSEAAVVDSEEDAMGSNSDMRGLIKLDPEDLTEVSAIAWDETIGRLCIGYGPQKHTRLAVFDFAAAPTSTIQ